MEKPKAICRIQKLKSWGEVGSSQAHTARTRTTLNANSAVENIRIIDTLGYEQRSLQDIFENKIRLATVRKNAVLLVEILLSASPQYFRPTNPANGGYYEPDRVNEFANACQYWLKEKYGNNLVRAELHLDEQTPHIHAYFIPIDDRNKLNCRSFFGGAQKLSRLQDDFAASLAHLGIERGIKGSVAEYVNVQTYYERVNSQTKYIDLDSLPHAVEGESGAEYRERVHRYLTPEVDIVNAQQREKDTIKNQNETLNLTLLNHERIRRQLDERVHALEEENFKFRQEAELLRDIALEEIAWHLGLMEDYYGKNRWKGYGHIIQIRDNKFFDFAPEFDRGGYGAIDFVMHVEQCNFRQAVAWLHDNFGEQGVIRAVSAQARNNALEFVAAGNESKPEPFSPPFPQESNWGEVKKYLIESRHLPKNWVEGMHQAGLLYSDSKHNAVFIMRSLENPEEISGAYLRGTRGQQNGFKGYAKNSARNKSYFYFRQGDTETEPTKAVLCKSPIDAISLAVQQQPVTENTMYIAVDSLRSAPFKYLDRFDNVVCAFEHSSSGDRLYKDLKKVIPNIIRLTPSNNDWNDDLQQLYAQADEIKNTNSKKKSKNQQR